MSGERPGYLSYLLRLWRVKEGDATRWRASLERPGDGERFVFGSLEATFDFLLERTGEAAGGVPVLPDGTGRGSEGNGPTAAGAAEGSRRSG